MAAAASFWVAGMCAEVGASSTGGRRCRVAADGMPIAEYVCFECCLLSSRWPDSGSRSVTRWRCHSARYACPTCPGTHGPDAPLVPQSQRCQCSCGRCCTCLIHGQPVADDPVRANESSDPTLL